MSRAGDPIGPVCPLCRSENIPIVDTTGRGDLAIGEHRHSFPIFALGYHAPFMRARCPMSGAPLTDCCDGDHAPPRCSDPQCWRTENPPDAAFPTKAPRPDGIYVHVPAAEREGTIEIMIAGSVPLDWRPAYACVSCGRVTIALEGTPPNLMCRKPGCGGVGRMIGREVPDEWKEDKGTP